MYLSQKMKSELAVAWCFAIPAFIALFEIHTKFVALGMHTGGGEQNAALFPRLLSCLLLFLVVLKTLSIVIESKKNPCAVGEAVIVFEKDGRRRLALIFLVFVLYLLGLNFLGYYAATPLALAAFFMILGIRKVLPLALLSLGVTIAVWYSFGILLKVILPVGRFGLYF